jgi:transcriptional regulator with XRE-family HTH domain
MSDNGGKQMGNTSKTLQKMEFGERLRQIRHHFGYSQDRMAELMSLSKITYAKNERGVSLPSLQTLFVLNSQFGISVEWFLFNQGAMFLKDRDMKKTEKKVENVFSPDVEEMLFLMRQIPVLRHSVLCHFENFKIDRKDLIRELYERIEKEKGAGGKV